MRRWLRRLVIIAVVLTIVTGCSLWLVYRMSRWEPSFYEHAVRIDTADAVRASDALEKNVLALHNEVVDQRPWQVTVSDHQVNGWLAAVLPVKFPELLPDNIEDPRVEFRDGQAELACRYVGRKLSVVVSVVVEVFLTEQPNVVAVRIRQARVGGLPGLKKRLRQRISLEARRRHVPLRWSQTGRDPVALVTLTGPRGSDWENLHLEVLRLAEGQLMLAGRNPATKEDAQ